MDVEGDAGRLLAVAEAGIEDQYFVRHVWDSFTFSLGTPA